MLIDDPVIFLWQRREVRPREVKPLLEITQEQVIKPGPVLWKPNLEFRLSRATREPWLPQISACQAGSGWRDLVQGGLPGHDRECLNNVHSPLPPPPDVKKGALENVQFLKPGSCICFLL